MVYSREEIVVLREGGRRLAAVLAHLVRMVRPGVSAGALEHEARRLIAAGGDTPSFLGYQGEEDAHPFPAALCVSVNNEVVHGIPSEEKVLCEGDIATLDLGLRHRGLCTDAAVTVPVGQVSVELQELVAVTKESLAAGIAAVHAGATTGDVGYAIESCVRRAGNFGIVRDLSGHGVGRKVHEEPLVPNFGKPGEGVPLEEGMVLALEPMLTLGAEKTKLGKDGFAYCTTDGSVAAHFEHTIVVTKERAEVLTEV